MNSDWARIYRDELRAPTDLIHNGHQYIKGTVESIESAREEVRARKARESFYCIGMKGKTPECLR
jgi:hypothetical protein